MISRFAAAAARWAGANLAIWVAALFLIWAYFAFMMSWNNEWRPYAAIGLFALGGIVSTMIHELGHAGAAWSVGWQPLVISTRYAAFHMPSRRPLISRRIEREGSGGWVAAVPGRADAIHWWRKAIFVAGGPIASLCLALFCFAVTDIVGKGSSRGIIDAGTVAFALGLMSFASFAATAIPNTANQGNDAHKICQIFRGGPADTHHDCVLWLSQMLHYNVRLRDLPQWMIDQAADLRDHNEEFARFFDTMEIGRTLDREPVDCGLARRQINLFWRNREPNDWLRACDAFLAAVYERDRTRAAAMIEGIGEPSDLPQMASAAHAALAMLDGDSDSARLHLRDMDAAIVAKSPYPDATFADIRRRVEAIPRLREFGDLPLKAGSGHA